MKSTLLTGTSPQLVPFLPSITWTISLKSTCERGMCSPRPLCSPPPLPHLFLPGMVWIGIRDGPDTLADIIHREGQHEVCLHLAGFEGGVLQGRGLWVRPGCTTQCGPQGANIVSTIHPSISFCMEVPREALLRAELHVIGHFNKKHSTFDKVQ